MTTLQQLIEAREIERVKARYFRYMDHRQWPEFRDLLTDDLQFFIDTGREHVAATPTWTSADALVSYLASTPESKITVHQGHMPDIEFVDDDHAQGVWAMFDWVDYPTRGTAFKGYGYYFETYVRCPDGRWRISSSRLTRLRTNTAESRESVPMEFSPDQGAHVTGDEPATT
jgi:SnoaL-like domain